MWLFVALPSRVRLVRSQLPRGVGSLANLGFRFPKFQGDDDNATMKDLPIVDMEQDREEPSVDQMACNQKDSSTETETAETHDGMRTFEELLAMCRQTKQVEFNDEYMDPFEWTVRKAVPMPAVYYWDVFEEQNESMKKDIPWKIRWWHKIVGSLENTSNVVNQWVALPIARTLGITDSRVAYVTESMTEEELQESKRVVIERRQRQQIISEEQDEANNKETA